MHILNTYINPITRHIFQNIRLRMYTSTSTYYIDTIFTQTSFYNIQYELYLEKVDYLKAIYKRFFDTFIFHSEIVFLRR